MHVYTSKMAICMRDIGNLHVIDYYLYLALVGWRWRGGPIVDDFDIETERREGWAYDRY